MQEKSCVLTEAKICDDCGKCMICDLDEGKICDNCMKCVEDLDREYNEVKIDGVQLEGDAYENWLEEDA